MWGGRPEGNNKVEIAAPGALDWIAFFKPFWEMALAC